MDQLDDFCLEKIFRSLDMEGQIALMDIGERYDRIIKTIWRLYFTEINFDTRHNTYLAENNDIFYELCSNVQKEKITEIRLYKSKHLRFLNNFVWPNVEYLHGTVSEDDDNFTTYFPVSFPALKKLRLTWHYNKETARNLKDVKDYSKSLTLSHNNITELSINEELVCIGFNNFRRFFPQLRRIELRRGRIAMPNIVQDVFKDFPYTDEVCTITLNFKHKNVTVLNNTLLALERVKVKRLNLIGHTPYQLYLYSFIREREPIHEIHYRSQIYDLERKICRNTIEFILQLVDIVNFQERFQRDAGIPFPSVELYCYVTHNIYNILKTYIINDQFANKLHINWVFTPCSDVTLPFKRDVLVAVEWEKEEPVAETEEKGAVGGAGI